LKKEDKEKLASLRIEKGRTAHYADVFDHIYKARETNLSVTIGLRIGNQELDVARFGAIPNPSP
jgi:hypothetical protein